MVEALRLRDFWVRSLGLGSRDGMPTTGGSFVDRWFKSSGM